MSKMLDASQGVVSVAELVVVLTSLQSEGSPRALHLSGVLGNIPIGGSVSEEVCSRLTQAVSNWQACRH
jgi:hypothetical protein